MNYPLAGLIVIVVIAGIIWLVKRNQKDEKDFEKEIEQSEIKPGKHEDPGDAV
jgi:hypothetical protein